MKNALLPLAAVLQLTGCVVVPPPNTVYYTERGDIYNGGYPVRAVVERIPMPLEMTPEEVAHYNFLRLQEAERNRRMLDGRVNNVQGW